MLSALSEASFARVRSPRKGNVASMRPKLRPLPVPHQHSHWNRRSHALRDYAEVFELREGPLEQPQAGGNRVDLNFNMDAVHSQLAGVVTRKGASCLRLEAKLLVLEFAQRRSEAAAQAIGNRSHQQHL